MKQCPAVFDLAGVFSPTYTLDNQGSYRQLDMAKYKLVVQLRGFSVILSRFCEFVHDEKNYRNQT